MARDGVSWGGSRGAASHSALILRSPPQAGVSKDGRTPGPGAHPSRRRYAPPQDEVRKEARAAQDDIRRRRAAQDEVRRRRALLMLRPEQTSVVEEAAELPRPRRMLELAQGLGLDLADALAGDRELLADLFERVVGVHADAEAHAQHPLLARGERGEDARRRLAQVRLDRGVDRQDGVLVLDEVAEVRIFLVADRGLERDRLFRDLQD